MHCYTYKDKQMQMILKLKTKHTSTWLVIIMWTVSDVITISFCLTLNATITCVYTQYNLLSHQFSTVFKSHEINITDGRIQYDGGNTMVGSLCMSRRPHSDLSQADQCDQRARRWLTVWLLWYNMLVDMILNCIEFSSLHKKLF